MRRLRSRVARRLAARRVGRPVRSSAPIGAEGEEPGPTFLIVGVMKGGTSSLHWYLGQHPEVFVTPRPHKELHYFDQKAEYRRRNRAAYLQHFAAARGFAARGESTPSYCFVPEATAAIAAFRSDMQLILMLRDPVDRAISHIEHRRREAARRPARLAHGAIWEELVADLNTPYWRLGPRPGNPRGYHARGHYHEQLRRLYERFPKEQVLVVRLEDLQADPQAQLDRVTDFLGVSRFRSADLTPHNVNRYEPPEPGVYEYLAAYYLPHNHILTKEFGIRTDDWRAPITVPRPAAPGW